MTAWRSAERGDLDEVLAYLRPREWGCVSFTSRLLARSSAVDHVFVNRAQTGDRRILESLLATEQGLVIPAIDPEHNPRGGYEEGLSPLLRSAIRRVHSIMGIADQVGVIQSLVPWPPSERVDYHLMTREYFNVLPPTGSVPGLKIRRATIADLIALFPLQRDYEKEEVLLDPGSFNASATLLSLQKNLRREIVYLAELDGQPVAKAGTNARGIDYCQIGGVFTIPGLRNRGIAGELMRTLMSDIAGQKKHLCLFVKKRNEPAERLYRSLGFAVRDAFAISYFRP